MVNPRTRSFNEGVVSPLSMHLPILADPAESDAHETPHVRKRLSICSPIPIACARPRNYSPAPSSREAHALWGCEQSMLGVSPKLGCENDIFDRPVSRVSGCSSSPPSHIAFHSSAPSSVRNLSGLGMFSTSPHPSDAANERTGRTPHRPLLGRMREQMGSRERNDRTRAWADNTPPVPLFAPTPLHLPHERPLVGYLSTSLGGSERNLYGPQGGFRRGSTTDRPVKEKAFGEAPGGREIEELSFEFALSDNEYDAP